MSELTLLETKRLSLEAAARSEERKANELKEIERKTVARYQSVRSEFQKIKEQLRSKPIIDTKLDRLRNKQLGQILQLKAKEVSTQNQRVKQVQNESNQAIMALVAKRTKLEKVNELVSQQKLFKYNLKIENEFENIIFNLKPESEKDLDLKKKVDELSFSSTPEFDNRQIDSNNTLLPINVTQLSADGGGNFNQAAQQFQSLPDSSKKQQTASAVSNNNDSINSFQSFIRQLECFKTSKATGVSFTYVASSGENIAVSVQSVNGAITLQLQAENSRNQKIFWEEKAKILAAFTNAGINIKNIQLSGQTTGVKK